jgi:hypothetical protein
VGKLKSGESEDLKAKARSYLALLRKVLRLRSEKKMNGIFCLPVQRFSGRFLDCWRGLVGYCFAQGIHFAVSR